MSAILVAASCLAALTVVESSDGLRIDRDGTSVVSAIAVDRGAVSTADVRRSFVRSEKGRIWNFWSECRDGRFRLEVAERTDGAVEITMAGEVDPSDSIRRRKLRLTLSGETFHGAEYTAWTGRHTDPIRAFGKFEDGTTTLKTRFLAGKGVVFDCNPLGIGDEYAFSSDGWKFMDAICGFGMLRMKDGAFTLESGADVDISWGGYTGSKIVIREGVFDDFGKYHSLWRFVYAMDSTPIHLLGFGPAKRGNAYAEGDVLFDARRGCGWLDSHLWDRVPARGCEPSGVLYSALTGALDETYRFSNLADGTYLVTFAAGNPGGETNLFSVTANGEGFVTGQSIAKGKMRRITKIVRSHGGRIDVALTGKWLLSVLALQPLMMDGEDFTVSRGLWLTDGYEPCTLYRNADVKPAVFPAQDELSDLPVRGREAGCSARDYECPVSLPDPDLPGLAWTQNAKICRVLNNSSSMANFDAPGELVRYFEKEIDGRGYNVIMLSGMLTRHTYPGHLERGLQAVKSITAEAHRRGYKVIDHFDATLVWYIGAGARALGERLDEMNRSVKTGLPAYQLCLMNPDFRRNFFEYCRRDVVEGGVDGLQLDEVQPWGHGCQCRHCRAAFRRDTGWDIPLDETASVWEPGSDFLRVWKRWRTKKVTDFIGELRASLKDVRPDLVFSAYTTPYGVLTGYDALTNGRDLFDMPRSVNFFGIEVMSRAVMKSYRAEFSCHRIMSMLTAQNGSPVWNWYYNSDWQNDYTAWAIDEMTAQLPMLAEVDHPAGTPDYAAFSQGMKRHGAVSPAKIAVLFSVENRNWNKNAKTGSDVNGIVQALDRLHIPCDVLGDDELERGVPERYVVLAYPEKTEFTAKQATALEGFRNRGGKTVACAGSVYAMPEFTVGYPRKKYYATSASDEAKFLQEVSAWASEGRVWEVSAPAQVCSSLFREADGAWAAHFLNMTGVDFTPDEVVTADAPVRGFPALATDVVFTVPSGSKAVATSPDFKGGRELAVSIGEDGRATVTLPKDCLKVYAFVRVR